METVFYPTLEEVLHLHRMLLERFGGRHGVRDLGLLESALSRPRSGYYETLATQAAALLQSFTMNHGFVDGNKRIAFAITAVFLRLNGYRVVVSADDAETFLVDEVVEEKASLERIAVWLHDHWQRAS